MTAEKIAEVAERYNLTVRRHPLSGDPERMIGVNRVELVGDPALVMAAWDEFPHDGFRAPVLKTVGGRPYIFFPDVWYSS